MSPKHEDGGGRTGTPAAVTNRPRNDSVISNPYADFGHIGLPHRREQETDTASMTNSTTSTRMSSIFDNAPSNRQQYQSHRSQQTGAAGYIGQTALPHQIHSDVHDPQTYAFHHQLGQVQAASHSPITQFSPFHPQFLGAQGESTRRQLAPQLNGNQGFETAKPYYEPPYAAPPTAPPMPMYSRNQFDVGGLQTRPGAADPQHSRPTLPPSSRRQATLANYDRMKAEHLAAENAEMAGSNVRLEQAIQFAGHAQNPMASFHHENPHSVGGPQHARIARPSITAPAFTPAPNYAPASSYATISSYTPAPTFAPIPVPINQSYFNNQLANIPPPAIYANLVRNAYHYGSDAMNPQTLGGFSDRYQHLLRFGTPGLHQALSNDNMPFTTTTATKQGTSYGVVRLGNVSTNDRRR